MLCAGISAGAVAEGLPAAGTVIEVFGSTSWFMACASCASPAVGEPRRSVSNRVAVKVVHDLRDDPGGLFLTKEAHPQRVERGDTVTYTLVLKNNRTAAARRIRVEDRLPPGFRYVRGSARIGSTPLRDPEGGGQALLFTLENPLAGGKSIDISYALRVGAAAGLGRRVNRAEAQAATDDRRRLLSGIARAEVTVRASRVFRAEAAILGKTFLDCDGDGIQRDDSTEPGVPGVRIVFEDGTGVVTDRFGRYSIYGFRPVTHVARLDPLSLPDGARPRVTDNRQAFDPASRFVDLQKGMLHRADFALGPCSPTVRATVEKRRAAPAGPPGWNSLIKRELVINEPGSVRHGVARGAISADGAVADGDAGQPASAVGPAARQGPSPTAGSPATHGQKDISFARNLAHDIRSFDNSLEFLELADGDKLARRILPVRVKGRAGVRILLFVNGVEIDASRIGQTAVWQDGETAAHEYVGVSLRPGANRLMLRQFDGFGIERERREIAVIAPGAPVRLEIEAPGNAIADGRSPIPVVVRLIDGNGLMSPDQAEVTLKTTAGRFDVADMASYDLGVQALIDNGEAVFDLIPPKVAGSRTVTVETAFGRFEKRIAFSPELRPMIVVGMFEGALDFGRRGEKIEHLLDNRDLGAFEKTQQGANGALYLKGRVRGDHLLTLAYDSDKDTRGRLFRDLQPHEFYPVYGDSSVREFDAQSSDKLYVRVEKGSSYALYGDFSSAQEQAPLELGNYARNLTGGKLHVEHGIVTVNAFAARVEHRSRTIEFRAAGTSGPYRLRADGEVVRNSEQVEIITRDRERPGVVIRRQRLTRFTDYSLGYLDDSILFSRPVPAVDPDGHPQFIRVVVELRGAAPAHWVYGANTRIRLADGVAAGVSAIRSADPGERFSLHGAYIEAEIGKNGKLAAEIARSRAETSGWAGRAEYTHTSETLEMSVKAAQTDESFDSPSALLAAGRREAKAEVRTRLREDIWVEAGALYSEGRETGERRTGIEAGVEYGISETLTLDLGARRVRESAGKSTSVFTGFGWEPKSLPNLSLETEVEQGLDDPENRRFSVAGEYGFKKGNIYAKHEVTASTDGVFGPGDAGREATTVVGGEYDGFGNLRSFSEYRARRSRSPAASAEVATGVRGEWEAAAGLRMRLRTERITGLGEEDEDSTAVTTSAEYDSPGGGWAGRAAVEWRGGNDADTWYGSVGAAFRVAPNWTALVQERIAHTDAGSGDDKLENRLRAGFAWRPVENNRIDALGWYEWVRQTGAVEGRGTKHLWSGTLNYRLTPRLVLNGGYAGKWSLQTGGRSAHRRLLQQVSGRMTYDLTDRIDVGVAGSTLFEGAFGSSRYRIGIEGGYLLQKNLWVSAGYNFLGYNEEDLGSGAAHGPYIRLRLKFDEGLLAWLQ